MTQGEPWQLIADRIVQDLEDDLFNDPLQLIAVIRADVDPSVAQLISRDPRYRRVVIDRKGEHVVILGVPYARDAAPGEPGRDEAAPDSASALPLVTRASRPPPDPISPPEAARRSSRPPPLPVRDANLSGGDVAAHEAEAIRVEEHELVED